MVRCIVVILPASSRFVNVPFYKVDLLYLHNAAEAHIPKYGKVAFLKRLKIAFQALEGMCWAVDYSRCLMGAFCLVWYTGYLFLLTL